MTKKKKSVTYYAILNGVNSYVGTEPDKNADESIKCESLKEAKAKVLKQLWHESDVLGDTIDSVDKMTELDFQ